MQRAQTYGLVALSIGIFLIAFANVGLGLMGFALTGDMLKEDFSSLASWTLGDNTAGSAVISPAGQCYFTATGRCSYVKSYGTTFPAQLTIEVKVYVDSWGGGNGEFYIWLQDGTYTHLLSIGPTQCRVATPVGVPVDWFPCVTTAGTWYTWTVTIDTAAPQQKVYRVEGNNAAQLIGTGNYVYRPADNKAKLFSFNEYVSTSTISSHIESLYIDTGLKPPGVVPPPNQLGTIQAYGYKNQVQVSGWSAYCVGPGGTTTTLTCTSPSAGVQWPNLDVGSWTVYGTYQGTSASKAVTVTSGGTATANLDFGGGAPPDDPWKWLTDFLRNPMFKAGMTGIGALLSCVGIFATVIPALRKKQQPSYF